MNFKKLTIAAAIVAMTSLSAVAPVYAQAAPAVMATLAANEILRQRSRASASLSMRASSCAMSSRDVSSSMRLRFKMRRRPARR